MVEACWTIPGQTNVPFHVGIPSKHLAILVEGHIEGITKATGQDGPRFSFGIDFGDVANTIILSDIVVIRKQPIILCAAIGGFVGDRFRNTTSLPITKYKLLSGPNTI